MHQKYNPSIPLHNSSNFIDFQNSVSHPMTKYTKEPVPDNFQIPCDNLQESIVAIEEVIQDFFHSENAQVSLEVAIFCSKLHRSKSDLVRKCMELIRLVKLFSCEWNITSENILALEQDDFKHWYVLDVAIRKMAVLESRLQKEKAEYALNNWIRLAKKVLYTEFIDQRETVAHIKDEFSACTLLISEATNKRLLERVDLLKGVVQKNQLIKEIQDNILDIPQDIQLQRDDLLRFKQLYKQVNPGYEYLANFLKQPEGIIYLSTRTGAFKLQPPKNRHLRRSKSCEAITVKLEENERVFKEYLEWRKTPKDETHTAGNPFRIGKALIRVNSYNCTYEVENLRSEIFETNNIDSFQVDERWLRGQNTASSINLTPNDEPFGKPGNDVQQLEAVIQEKEKIISELSKEIEILRQKVSEFRPSKLSLTESHHQISSNSANISQRKGLSSSENGSNTLKPKIHSRRASSSFPTKPIIAQSRRASLATTTSNKRNNVNHRIAPIERDDKKGSLNFHNAKESPFPTMSSSVDKQAYDGISTDDVLRSLIAEEDTKGLNNDEIKSSYRNVMNEQLQHNGKYSKNNNFASWTPSRTNVDSNNSSFSVHKKAGDYADQKDTTREKRMHYSASLMDNNNATIKSINVELNSNLSSVNDKITEFQGNLVDAAESAKKLATKLNYSTLAPIEYIPRKSDSDSVKINAKSLQKDKNKIHESPRSSTNYSKIEDFNFLQRNALFSLNKQRNDLMRQKRVQEQERKTYERRLKYFSLLRTPEANNSGKHLIPAFKDRRKDDNTIEEFFHAVSRSVEPWGGRFKIHHKMYQANVINLFEMTIDLPQSSSSDEDASTADEE